MAIEVKPELGQDRDQGLFARWLFQRIQLERDFNTAHADPDVPITIVSQMAEEANLLDHFLIMGPDRMKMWSEELVSEAHGHLRFAEGLIAEIKGMPKSLPDIGG